MVNSKNIIQSARTSFSSYLEKKGLRKTNERFAILEEIYGRSDHFDAETLYVEMNSHHSKVSRATVYNTLDLLVSCGLVKRHQFEKNHTRYEKSFGSRQHDHLICSECSRVIEFCDPRIQQIQATMGKLFSFEINQHALTMYGTCTTQNCEFAHHQNL